MKDLKLESIKDPAYQKFTPTMIQNTGNVVGGLWQPTEFDGDVDIVNYQTTNEHGGYDGDFTNGTNEVAYAAALNIPIIMGH